MNARIDPVLSDVLRVGLLAFTGGRVAAADDAVAAEASKTAAHYRAAFRDFEIGSIPGVHAARAVYRVLGIDPTKTRPSSEALLRRALKGQPLPSINTAVDLANLVALRRLLPVGLYDLAQVHGDVVIRLGRTGEQYEAISGDVVHLEGRIAVCDGRGPFGNPTRDSRRTHVRLETSDLLFVVFAPSTPDQGDSLRSALGEAEQLFTRHLGAVVEQRNLLPGRGEPLA